MPYYKEIFSFIAVFLTLYAYIPYALSIYKGTTKPHVFSWIIWGLTTFIVFLAQLADHGGLGAWPLGFSGIITIIIAYMAYVKNTNQYVTRLDWFFLIVALLSLLVWAVTDDPIWTVIILTIVDLLGFGPTIRKAYAYPLEEQASFYGIFVIRNGAIILALEHYSVTTLLFPIATALACFWLVWVIAKGHYLHNKSKI